MSSNGEQAEVSMEIEDGEIPNQEEVMDNESQEFPSTQDLLAEIPGLVWSENGWDLNLENIGVIGPLPEPVYTPAESVQHYPQVDPVPHYFYPNPSPSEYYGTSSNLSVEESSYNPYTMAYPTPLTLPTVTPVIDPYHEATMITRANETLQHSEYVSRKDYLELTESYYRMKSERDQARNMLEDLKKLVRRFGYQARQTLEDSKYPLML